MEPSQLSVTEYAVLSLLGEGPSHGFAISKELAPAGPVGRVLTVRQPLVYRALDRLVDAGLAERASVEPGRAGPRRVVHRITSRGTSRLAAWLSQPVAHVRDLRIEFLLKLVLLQRSGASPAGLVARQRAALRETLAALDDSTAATTDPVELWRRHNATAAAGFLAHLEDLHRPA